MLIPDNQKIAIYWNDKPVGLVVGRISRPSMFDGKIATVSWFGECLGEEIREQSPNEVYRRAREIAKARGLRHICLGDGSDVHTIYTPAQEE